MRLLLLKPRHGPSSAFLMITFFALKESKLLIPIYYTNTLKSEIITAKTCELISTDEKLVANNIAMTLYKFAVTCSITES